MTETSATTDAKATARGNRAVRITAAAFVAGACLAGPQTAVATADDASSASSASSSTSDTRGSATTAGAGEASSARPSRSATTGVRGGVNRSASVSGVTGPDTTEEAAPVDIPSSDPQPARPARATGARAAVAESAPADRGVVNNSVTPAPETGAVAAPSASTPESSAPAGTAPAATETAPAEPVGADAAVSPDAPSAASVTPAAATDTAPVETTTPAISTPAPVAAAAGTVAGMTAATGTTANATGATGLDGLFTPFQSFIEGAALLLRRALFNQAPNLSPVQLTGLSEGPITGALNAVDPENDPLTYKITAAPQYGIVVINADGSYTYTPGTDFTGTDRFVVAVTDGGWHINLLDLTRPASTSASLAVAQGALASVVQFQFVYRTGAQYWSSAARAALESTATQLSSYISVDSPVIITYAVTGKRSFFSSNLASAGSDFVNSSAGFQQTVVQGKILTGVDANGSAADGTIDWNFGQNWALGNSVSSTQYDFRSTALHEMVHTLGFLSNTGAPGSNTGKVWTVYDSYLVNSAGTQVISDSYVWNTAYNANLTGGNGGLYFGGPNAVAAYGGPVPLYTPNPWQSGSSMSHLNDKVFVGAKDKLMNAVTDTGPGIRVISPIELGILQDLGYTLTGGSGTSTLLFVGFFTVRLRRRRAEHGQSPLDRAAA